MNMSTKVDASTQTEETAMGLKKYTRVQLKRRPVSPEPVRHRSRTPPLSTQMSSQNSQQNMIQSSR
eukprot:1657987-Karenia_brevis.AAC.1